MNNSGIRKAVILLSGGLDSATCLALAKEQDFELYALTLSYGQKHKIEVQAAKKIAKALKAAKHKVLNIDLGKLGGSALTSRNIPVPKKNLNIQGENENNDISTPGIPNTYVPARNMIFLAFAAGWAEVLGAKDIFIGVNSVDYSGYPDCRPEFIKAFTNCLNLGTKAADEKWKFKIHTPLQTLKKSEIISMGIKLGVDYSLTHSCYDPDRKKRACGHCDSCIIRKNGFAEAGIKDPKIYRLD